MTRISTPPSERTRAALITNIVAPYRIPTLRELSRSVDLTVLFSADREANRLWAIPEKLPFPHEVLGGPQLHVQRRHLYLNPLLLARLLRLRPDVVLVGGFSIPTLWAMVYCRLTHSGLVIISEGTRSSEGNGNVAERVSRRAVVRAARAFVGISTDAVDRFCDLGAARGDCVRSPYALDVAERPVRNYDRDAARLRFLYVGQLIERKGIRQLLRSLSSVAKLYPCELTIIGYGPLERMLREDVVALGLQSMVCFCGFVDQDRLPSVYAEHDVVVFPSLRESFGVVLLEAMAAGVPVVASKLAGSTRDFVDHGVNGWTVDPQSEVELRGVLVEACVARARLPEMGRSARDTIERNPPQQSATAILMAIERAAA
jgi:glycosyltransferase involved in cell wall biosynthesis